MKLYDQMNFIGNGQSILSTDLKCILFQATQLTSPIRTMSMWLANYATIDNSEIREVEDFQWHINKLQV